MTPANESTVEHLRARLDDARTRADSGEVEAAAEIAAAAVLEATRVVGPTHRDLLDGHVLLSELSMRTGSIGLAVVSAENAFSIVDEHFGEDDPEAGNVLRALGRAYLFTGDHVSAPDLLGAALAVHEDALGPDHPEVASDLLALVDLYLKYPLASNPTFVVEALGRAGVIREGAFGEQSRENAEVWRYRGMTIIFGLPDASEPGYEKAARAAEMALDASATILDRAGVSARLDRLELLRARRDLYLKTGDDERAMEMCMALLQESTSAPDVANDALGYAILCAKQGDAESVVAACGAANSISHWQFRQFAGWSGMADKLTYRDRANAAENICLALVHGLNLPPDEKGEALMKLLVRWRGATFRFEKQHHQLLRRAGDDEWTHDAAERARLRTELASALISFVGPNPPDPSRVEELASELGWREEILALEGTLRPTDGDLDSDLDIVQLALETRCAALVQYVKINRFDLERQAFDGTAKYVAIVTDGSSSVSYPLGDAHEVESRIRVAIGAFIGADPLSAEQQMPHLSVLHRLLWTPFAGHLADREISEVHIAVDGPIAQVPFAALPDEDGRFVVEDLLLSRVASPFDLWPADEPANPFTHDAVVFGAPDFGDMSTAPNQRLVFPALHGAAAEIEAVRPLLGREVLVVQADSATETAVREADPARIVHFATHGFYLDDDALAPLHELNDHLQDLGARPLDPEIGLVRSGLAMAGANEPAGGAIDGLITALEVADMDFSGTHLVTLSACESGLGLTHTGEGVLGLGYAFQAAGASNVLMSLWNVRSGELIRQMKTFYEFVSLGHSVSSALQRTQISRIEWMRRKNDGLAPPAVWGAFIAQTSSRA